MADRQKEKEEEDKPKKKTTDQPQQPEKPPEFQQPPKEKQSPSDAAQSSKQKIVQQRETDEPFVQQLKQNLASPKKQTRPSAMDIFVQPSSSTTQVEKPATPSKIDYAKESSELEAFLKKLKTPPAMVPIDIDKSADVLASLSKQFPQLGVAENKSNQKELTGLLAMKDYLSAGDPEAILSNFNVKMQKLMVEFAPAFNPTASIKIDASTFVHLGSPMNLGGEVGKAPSDVAIPVFIEINGRTQLVMAYMSESQSCWRRYAGLAVDTYAKGDNQHFQNFDWKIQKTLDGIFNSKPALEITRDGNKRLNLKDFGLGPAHAEIGIIAASEEGIQQSMLSKASVLTVVDPANKPVRIIDFWPASSRVYGPNIHAIVNSVNDRYSYGIAITREGIFVQYIQDNLSKKITRSGSPEIGVKLNKKDEWIMTPLFEYTDEAKDLKQKKSNGGKFEREIRNGIITFEDTKVGARAGGKKPIMSTKVEGERTWIRGLHNSPQSLFYVLNRNLRGVCKSLAENDLDEALEEMRGFVG